MFAAVRGLPRHEPMGRPSRGIFYPGPLRMSARGFVIKSGRLSWQRAAPKPGSVAARRGSCGLRKCSSADMQREHERRTRALARLPAPVKGRRRVPTRGCVGVGERVRVCSERVVSECEQQRLTTEAESGQDRKDERNGRRIMRRPWACQTSVLVGRSRRQPNTRLPAMTSCPGQGPKDTAHHHHPRAASASAASTKRSSLRHPTCTSPDTPWAPGPSAQSSLLEPVGLSLFNTTACHRPATLDTSPYPPCHVTSQARFPPLCNRLPNTHTDLR